MLVLMLSLVAAACGGGAEPDSTTPTTTESVAVTTTSPELAGTPIGPDGGIVTSDDGLFIVEIPSGALGEILSVGIEIGSAADLGVEEGLLAGPIYQLTPDGTIFDAPVTIVRRLSSADLGIGNGVIPFFHVFQGSVEGWVPLSTETKRDGDVLVVSADTVHFSPNVVVETVRLFDGIEKIELLLEPAEFAVPINSSHSTSWSAPRSATGNLEIVRRELALTFGGAVVAHREDDELFWEARASCGDVAGEGTYGVEISGDALGVGNFQGFDIFLALFLGLEGVSQEHYTLTATGSAVCTEPDLSLIDSVAGVGSGTVEFQTHENSPPGVDFAADFEIEIDAGVFVVKTTQKPNQKTEGPIDPATLIYFTTGQAGTHFEAYIGGVCPNSDGSYYVGGYSFGGPPSMAQEFQAFLDSIEGLDASVSDPASISVDPSLVPSCDQLYSDPWGFAIDMRTIFGPLGSIPSAQWDLLFAGEMTQSSD